MQPDLFARFVAEGQVQRDLRVEMGVEAYLAHVDHFGSAVGRAVGRVRSNGRPASPRFRCPSMAGDLSQGDSRC